VRWTNRRRGRTPEPARCGFEAQFEQARLATENRFLALYLDRDEVGVGESDATPERARAGANKIDQNKAIACGGITNNPHRLAELGTGQDNAISEVIG